MKAARYFVYVRMAKLRAEISRAKEGRRASLRKQEGELVLPKVSKKKHESIPYSAT